VLLWPKIFLIVGARLILLTYHINTILSARLKNTAECG